jgi:hypothetical protein
MDIKGYEVGEVDRDLWISKWRYHGDVMEMSWKIEGDLGIYLRIPKRYLNISQKISEHIPEDLVVYPKKISLDIRINGYPI